MAVEDQALSASARFTSLFIPTVVLLRAGAHQGLVLQGHVVEQVRSVQALELQVLGQLELTNGPGKGFACSQPHFPRSLCPHQLLLLLLHL